jgi:hypothetical protein
VQREFGRDLRVDETEPGEPHHLPVAPALLLEELGVDALPEIGEGGLDRSPGRCRGEMRSLRDREAAGDQLGDQAAEAR